MNKESIKNCRTQYRKTNRKKKKEKHLIRNKTRYFPIFQKEKKKEKNKAIIHVHFYAF